MELGSCRWQILSPAIPASIKPSVKRPVLMKPDSKGKSEPMVLFRRSSLHPHLIGNGVGDDSGTRLSLLGSGAKKIGPEHDLCVHGLHGGHHLPMVLLGIFLGLFCAGHKWFHWGSEALWFDQHAGCSESRVSADSGARVQLLSSTHPRPSSARHGADFHVLDAVCRNNGGHHRWSCS